MKLSIIIPFFNEEKTILPLWKELKALSPQKMYEIIFVDDGSTDNSAEKIQEIQKENANIVLVHHSENLGKGAAVKSGITVSTGDFILVQDADMEYHPKYIPLLLAPIQKGVTKVVFGTRLKRPPHFHAEEHTLQFAIHYFGNRILSFITSVLYKTWITDMETGYKIFPKSAIDNCRLHSQHFDIEPEITAKLLKKGYRIEEVPITTKPRGYKEGKKLHTVRDGFAALFALVKYRFYE